MTESDGGFTPYGWTPGLSAIATAGIIYAYTGFQGPVDLSGEARNPRRDVPRAVIISLAGSMPLYLLLQVVFIGAVPGHDLIHGWNGVSFSSPFAELAVAANLTWLSWVLYADAIASPAGSAWRSPRRPAAHRTRWPRTGSCRAPSGGWTGAPGSRAAPCSSTS